MDWMQVLKGYIGFQVTIHFTNEDELTAEVAEVHDDYVVAVGSYTYDVYYIPVSSICFIQASHHSICEDES